VTRRTVWLRLPEAGDASHDGVTFGTCHILRSDSSLGVDCYSLVSLTLAAAPTMSIDCWS
jgi:hypothetical protein